VQVCLVFYLKQTITYNIYGLASLSATSQSYPRNSQSSVEVSLV
jgi:hypothetical protein